MLSAREQVYYEKRDNLRKYGLRVLDWEITNIVMDELAPLLGAEVISMLTPLAQHWISEHVDHNEFFDYKNKNKETYDRQPDSISSDSGQGSMGESQESRISFGSNPDSGVLVESTE